MIAVECQWRRQHNNSILTVRLTSQETRAHQPLQSILYATSTDPLFPTGGTASHCPSMNKRKYDTLQIQHPLQQVHFHALQQQSLDFAATHANKNILFPLPKGSGKTILLLELVRRFLYTGGGRKRVKNELGKTVSDVAIRRIVHLVCPNAVLSRFYDEMCRYFPTMVQQLKAQERPKHTGHRWLFVYNYETFAAQTGDKDLMPFFGAHTDRTLYVFDEAHLLNNGKSQRGELARKLAARENTRVYLGTGSVFINDVHDFDNLGCILTQSRALKSVNPQELPAGHIAPEQLLPSTTAPGSTATTAEASAAPTLADEFPAVRLRTESLRMNPAQYKAYRGMEVQVMGKGQAFYMQLRQYLNRLSSADEQTNSFSLKVDWILNYLNEHRHAETRRLPRIVIYSYFHDAGNDLLIAALRQHGYSYQQMRGNAHQTVDDRQMILQQYNSGREPLLLLSDAGALGLDLKATHTLICMDVPWNDAKLQQIRARVARYRSHELCAHKEVHIVTLLVEKPEQLDADDPYPDSIDRYMWNVCQQKAKDLAVAHELLGQTSSSPDNDNAVGISVSAPSIDSSNNV